MKSSLKCHMFGNPLLLTSWSESFGTLSFGESKSMMRSQFDQTITYNKLILITYDEIMMQRKRSKHSSIRHQQLCTYILINVSKYVFVYWSLLSYWGHCNNVDLLPLQLLLKSLQLTWCHWNSVEVNMFWSAPDRKNSLLFIMYDWQNKWSIEFSHQFINYYIWIWNKLTEE